MASINQAYAFLNSVTAEMWGEQAITVKDTASFVSVGEQYNELSEANKDAFARVLFDRIARTVIDNTKFTSRLAKMFMVDYFTFGAILRRIHINVIPATDNPAYSLENNRSVDKYIVNKPEYEQDLYQSHNSWEIDVTIPDAIIMASAFLSPEDFAGFVNGIYLALENSVTQKIDAACRMALCNYIAECIKNGFAVNVLEEFHTFTGDNTLSASACFKDKEFIRFANQFVNLYRTRMGEVTETFNVKKRLRQTTEEDLMLTVHSEFSSGAKFYLYGDTYNESFVRLGDRYTELNYWQGSGTAWQFSETTGINIKPASSGAEDPAVVQTGIFALLCDKKAIGTTIYNQRTKSTYNERGEYTNVFEKTDIGYYNDLGQNGYVFYVADPVVEG